MHKDSRGFTIIELLIATAVFAMVLLLCATAVVQVGRMFYKGTVFNRTQATSRTVIDDISQSIQFGPSISLGTVPSASTTIGGVIIQSYCLGTVRYSYTLSGTGADHSLGNGTGQVAHVLWKDRPGSSFISGCIPANITLATPTAGGQELLGDNMRLSLLTVTPNTNGIFAVSIRLAYGATADVFTDDTYQSCRDGNLGGQFCAVSGITTNVTRRLQ